MKIRSLLLLAFLAVVVGAIVLFGLRPREADHDMTDKTRKALPEPLPSVSQAPVTTNAQKPSTVHDAAKKIGEVSLKMNDTEFSRLKVNLPPPVRKEWKGPLFDSSTCFEPQNKSIAVRVLPVWIRKAVLSGEFEMASGFLWSFMQFLNDAAPEISTAATIGLYRMGDFKDAARHQMRKWIENGFEYSYSDATAVGEAKDIRAQVLEELQLNNDRGLDQFIYDNWLRNQATEGKELAAVDYAYYLQKRGRDLPGEYWAQRLDNPYGFEHALEVAEQKSAPELTTKLQTIFEQLRARPAATPDASRAASVASALFRQTGDARYRDYLAEQAQAQLASGSFESSLPKVLEGLAGTKDKAALEIVSGAMQHDNEMVREMAIDALGKSRDPAAAELLFEAAIQKAKQGKGFPARELRALLAQDDPSAESKYERLQQALLSGQLGWSATTSDFEALEFFRKHGRQ